MNVHLKNLVQDLAVDSEEDFLKIEKYLQDNNFDYPKFSSNKFNMINKSAKDVNVGVIGLGVGEQHIYGFQKSKYADPILICDFDEKKLADVAIRSGIKNSTTDAEQILKHPNIDIVSIASFDQFHASRS